MEEEKSYSILYIFLTLQFTIFVGALMLDRINGRNTYTGDEEDDIIIF